MSVRLIEHYREPVQPSIVLSDADCRLLMDVLIRERMANGVDPGADHPVNRMLSRLWACQFGDPDPYPSHKASEADG